VANHTLLADETASCTDRA